MTIETAWQTTVGAAYKDAAKSVELKIKEGVFSNRIYLESGEDLVQPYSIIYDVTVLSKPICILPYNGDDVAVFKHPIVLENLDSRYASVVAVDVRDCMSGPWGRLPRVSKPIQLAWAKAQGLMQAVYVSEGFNRNVLKSMSNYPAALYSSMITEALQRRYYLDMREQITIQILSAHFYNNCLMASDVSADIDRQIGEIAKITRCDSQMIKNVLMKDGVREMKTISNLCECIKAHSGSIRLNDLSIGVLFTTLGSYWLGFNARELIAVSLEHVPTWLLLCYSALSSQTYKRSLLSKIAERSAKAHNGDGFVSNMAKNYLLATAQEL
jgi:hypothetical protein